MSVPSFACFVTTNVAKQNETLKYQTPQISHSLLAQTVLAQAILAQTALSPL